MNDKELPLQYYSAIGIIAKHMPKDSVYIGEGSNTMDIGRTIVKHEEPRLKLDAATFGVMGVGMPFAIAAKLHYNTKQVFAIVGDSAFGFSAMELETATRYKLPFAVLIINNNGLFSGIDELPEKTTDISFTNLNPGSKYELFVTCLECAIV